MSKIRIVIIGSAFATVGVLVLVIARSILTSIITILLYILANLVCTFAYTLG